MPVLSLIGTPRPSALAEVDADGSLVRLDLLDDDHEILAALQGEPAILTIDAPLHVPNARGRRVIEDLLSWCDIPLLPVARERLERLYGGLRGEALRPALEAAGHEVWETSPDAVLRELSWEETETGLLDLADYRERWIGLRAPRFRPSLTGRAHPEGVAEAWARALRAVEPSGHVLADGDDDWTHIANAARVDALACAIAALRHRQGTSTRIEAGPVGRMTLPTDANLAGRLALHAERLRAGGAQVVVS